MAFASSISGVAFLDPLHHDLLKGDFLLFSFGHWRCKTYVKNARMRSHFMTVKAVLVEPDIDFSNQDWKKQYQADFNRRFNLPHLNDDLDVEPRPTTFSLVSR